MDFSHYYKEPVIRMGTWALSPLDSSANWHDEAASEYFRKFFGFNKGTLVIGAINPDTQYGYFPKSYFDRLYRYITDINKKDYKALEKKLKLFYKFKKEAKREVPKITAKDLSKLSNPQLVALYRKNR